MSKTFHSDIADFTLTSATAPSNVAYVFKDISPGIYMGSGEYCVKDQTSLDNFALTFYYKFLNATSSGIRVAFGCDNTGVGYSFDYVISTATDVKYKINQLTTAGWTNAPDTTLYEIDAYHGYVHNISNVNEWRKLSIVIAGSRLQIYTDDDYLFYEDLNFTISGTHWGLASLGTNVLYISDVYVYENQIFYGNVNIDGTTYSENGYVNLYNQQDMSFVKRSTCDTNGDYMLFIEDDPINQNKYYILGYYSDKKNIQPRGVSNLYVQ